MPRFYANEHKPESLVDRISHHIYLCLFPCRFTTNNIFRDIYGPPACTTIQRQFQHAARVSWQLAFSRRYPVRAEAPITVRGRFHHGKMSRKQGLILNSPEPHFPARRNSMRTRRECLVLYGREDSTLMTAYGQRMLLTFKHNAKDRLS